MVGVRETCPWIWSTARWLTELGGWKFLWPLALTGAAMLALRGYKRHALGLLAVAAGGRILVETLKWLTDRARPALFEHAVMVHSQSFPSGHAANSMIAYLSLALIVAPLFTKARWPVAAAIALAVAIGLTRPLLGVHWPSDVLAGWALGLAWTLAMVWALRGWMERRPRDRPPDRP